MNSIKRYGLTGGESSIHEWAYGHYVRYYDYCVLEAERNELKASLEAVEKERDDLSELLDAANECVGKNFARAERAEAAIASAKKETLQAAIDALDTKRRANPQSDGQYSNAAHLLKNMMRRLEA